MRDVVILSKKITYYSPPSLVHNYKHEGPSSRYTLFLSPYWCPPFLHGIKTGKLATYKSRDPPPCFRPLCFPCFPQGRSRFCAFNHPLRWKGFLLAPNACLLRGPSSKKNPAFLRWRAKIFPFVPTPMKATMTSQWLPPPLPSIK